MDHVVYLDYKAKELSAKKMGRQELSCVNLVM